MTATQLKKIRCHAGLESVVILTTKARTPAEETYMGRLHWPPEFHIRKPHFQFTEEGELKYMVLQFSWLARLRLTKRWRHIYSDKIFRLPIPESILRHYEIRFLIQSVRRGFFRDEILTSTPLFFLDQVIIRTPLDEEITISNNGRVLAEARFIEQVMAAPEEPSDEI